MKHSNTFIVQLLLLCLCTTNGGAFLQGQQLTTSAVPRQPRRGRIPFPIYPGVEDVAFSRPGGKHVIETNNASLFGRRNTAASDGDDDHQHSLGLRSVIKSRIRAWWNVLVWFRGSTAWRKRFSVLKRRVMLLVISLALILNSTTVPAWAAVSGGRAGGTFKSSSSHRPSVSRHYSQPRHYHRPMYYQPRIHKPIYVSPPLGASYAQRPMAGGVSTMTKSDVLVLGSAAGLITYGVIQKRRNNNNDGSTNFNGATSTAVRFALNVPDRYDPNSIVHRLNEIAKRTDTSTQNGVQTLISEVCLELLRQQASLQASWSDSNHYRTSNAALKDFQGLSVESRTRYDQETASYFNDNDYTEETKSSKSKMDDGKATMAVVTIHFVTEGEDVSHFKNMRADVVNMLRWMAATVPASSLLAGEVLWSPQKPSDALSKREIDERYPELTPLI